MSALAASAVPFARTARVALAILTGLVGITAVAGGATLVASALLPELRTVLAPPAEYLDGSPFASFVLPGLVLAVVVGGTHLAAFAAVVRGTPRRHVVATIAAFGLLIWIFVQMMFIPFSPLQAGYFLAGLAETGLVLLLLGLFRDATGALPSRPVGRTIEG